MPFPREQKLGSCDSGEGASPWARADPRKVRVGADMTAREKIDPMIG